MTLARASAPCGRKDRNITTKAQRHKEIPLHPMRYLCAFVVIFSLTVIQARAPGVGACRQIPVFA